MKSLWSMNTEIPARESLEKDIETEVAIIGAGMAGILTGYFLQNEGYDVVILEASTIGSGQTHHTTAKITSQHNLIYDKLITDLGLAKAIQYADANEKAIALYEEIVEKEHIDCDFKILPSYLYSEVEHSILRKEAEAAKKAGIKAEYVTETELPFPVKGAVKFDNQAQFQPLEFMKGIAEKLTIYENTKVTTVDHHKVVTRTGVVTANHIVFATHYPFINMPGYYFTRMHQERSYIIALENAVQLNGMYYGIDKNAGLSFRNYGDYLLLGAGKHRTGENSEGGKYQKLRDAAARLFPGSKIIAEWSAQDCMTLDGVPYIGKYSASRPDWYVATGFGKWGMTSSMVSADIITNIIMEKYNPNTEVFIPQRFKVSDSANLMNEGSHAVKGLIKGSMKLPKETLEELPVSHGGIVEFNGEKVGVYKTEGGVAYIVSTKCPHLGCQLEWNPDELSWDCPCHGSRFDFKGNLLDNPAQRNVELNKEFACKL